MANTGILIGGWLVRTTEFTDIRYNHKEGFIVKFSRRGKTYIHVTKVNFLIQDSNTIATAGYFEELPFLKYRVKEIKSEEIQKFQLSIGELEKGVENDTIIIQKLNIESPFTNFCEINRFSWPYIGGSALTDDGKIKIPAQPAPTTLELAVPMDNVATLFYQRNLPQVNTVAMGLREQAAYLLALIAIQINNIQINIFPLFANDIALQEYIDSQNFEWEGVTAFNNPTLEDFRQYFANITAFYNILYANQLAIQKANSKKKLFWLAYVLSPEALAIVPVSLKTELLKNICYGPVIEGSMLIELMALNPLYGIPIKPVINQEEIIVKIVRSVLFAPLQIDEFLNHLTNIYDANDGKTLFEIMYEKVNDFGGSENLKSMMDNLYKCWISSSFYPYNIDGSLRDNLVNPDSYANKPITLGYASSSIALFFNGTNYDFEYRKKNIAVYSTDDLTFDGVVYRPTFKGLYGIYQSISISKSDSDLGSLSFVYLNVGNQELSVMPIFYLKYLDDKKSNENLTTGISLTIDIILTLSGIGNLAKLRHLRSVTRLGVAALGYDVSFLPGDILARWSFFRGVLGVFEITGSLGSIFINYSKQIPTFCTVGSPTYNEDKCEFYTTLNNWFLALQIISPTADFATYKIISGSAKRILQGPIPDDVSPDVLNILRKFAGNIDEIMDVYRVRLIQNVGEDSVIWQRIQAAADNTPGQFSIAQRDEFIIDFIDADKNKLLELNDASLIDNWRNIDDLENFSSLRRNITFLKNLKYITDSEELNIEIFEGRNGKVLKRPNLDPNKENSYIWIGKGVHHQDALLPPDPIARIVGSKQPLNNLGYYKAKVQIYNEDLSTKWVVKNSKKGMSTFFPDTWTRRKVQQELALAYQNKKYSNANQYIGKMSDGIEVRFYLNNDLLTSAHPNL